MLRARVRSHVRTGDGLPVAADQNAALNAWRLAHLQALALLGAVLYCCSTA